MNKILNTLSQAKKIRRLKVLFTKVIRRLGRYIFGDGSYETKKLINNKKLDWKKYCKQIDKKYTTRLEFLKRK